MINIMVIIVIKNYDNNINFIVVIFDNDNKSINLIIINTFIVIIL